MEVHAQHAVPVMHEVGFRGREPDGSDRDGFAAAATAVVVAVRSRRSRRRRRRRCDGLRHFEADDDAKHHLLLHALAPFGGGRFARRDGEEVRGVEESLRVALQSAEEFFIVVLDGTVEESLGLPGFSHSSCLLV
nr:hypothetical protein CFP56_11526 [Quercus suber]